MEIANNETKLLAYCMIMSAHSFASLPCILPEWCDKFYLPMNIARLAKAYKETCKRLEIMGAHVRKARAGFFVWFSVQPFMMENTEKEEMGNKYSGKAIPMYNALFSFGVQVTVF